MATILIADYTEYIRINIASIDKKGNHEVVGEAENGEEAVRLYRELQPDIVTMDITMPVMNGIEAIREIMKINSNANIIVCSAMGQQKVVVEAIEAGAKDFIIKPFDESRVLETIDR